MNTDIDVEIDKAIGIDIDIDTYIQREGDREGLGLQGLGFGLEGNEILPSKGLDYGVAPAVRVVKS